MAGMVTLILVVRPGLAADNLKELVALVRAAPDRHSFGSPGLGSAHHLLAELIKARESLRLTHVPYAGSAKAVVDLIEGRFDFMFLDATVAMPHIASGKLRPLVVTGRGRYHALPDAPALADTYPDFDSQPWMSFVGPAGLPDELAERINGEINNALREQEFATKLQIAGLAPMPLTIQSFGDLIRRDSARWAQLVRISGARAE